MDLDVDERQRGMLNEFYSRPGYLTRRVHQISMSIFMETGAKFDLTPTQYGVLLMLNIMTEVDQGGIVRLLGHDRSSIALAVSNLKARKLLEDRTPHVDRRRKTLMLTRKGDKLFRDVNETLAGVQDKMFRSFEPDERAIFVKLMTKVVDSYDQERE
jgi:DNA-binding MarR family transcriptional regulator